MSVPRTSARCVVRVSTERRPQKYGPRDCACGAPTRNYDHACPRCRFLDQSGGRSAGSIVASLRDVRCMTLLEIAEVTGRSVRNVLRALQRLMSIGRLERFEEEIEYETRGAARGATRWQYRLTG